MKNNVSKYLKPSSIILAVLIVTAGFVYVKNQSKTEDAENKLIAKDAENSLRRIESRSATLQVDGHGFAVGDIVQITTGRPAFGDIIVYDPFENNSMCFAMGPSMSLGKILGVPGEVFSFQNGELHIRMDTVVLDRDYSQQKAVFQSKKYENLVGSHITLQAREYLLDQWVGQECFPGEFNESGSVPYNRFTVTEGAIIGVIEKKIGHDDQAEQEFRDRVY